MLTEENKIRASKYIVLTGDDYIDKQSIKALENLRLLVKANKSNDKLKYALPECLKTSLVMTINARSLQNFLALRTNKAALPEMQELAREVFNKLPEDHKYLFEEYLYKDKNESN